MTSTPTRPVDNVVIATKGLQDRNINILAGTTVENKGKKHCHSLKRKARKLRKHPNTNFLSVEKKYEGMMEIIFTCVQLM